MTHKKFILPNGLRLITVPMPTFESVTVMVLVGAGSRYESASNSGISHFLEHMAFKGTTKRPTSLAIAGQIDGIGGDFNAFTNKEVTGYYVKAQSTHLELCIDILSDMLQDSLFDPIEIDKEKGVILEEINMYEDDPMRNLGDVYEELLYGDTPMGWDTAGKKSVIKQTKREDFLAYMQSLYSADNITVVVAGGIDEAQVKMLIDHYLSSLKQFDIAKALPISEDQHEATVFIKHKKTEQTHIALGVRTVGIDHPDRYAIDTLAAVLGGGMSSRLFAEVREKLGLAYYVRTSSDNYTDCGTLVTSAGVDKERVHEAVKAIVDQLRMVKEKGITAEELTKAKELSKGHFVLDLEDSRSVASFYAHEEILEKELLSPDEVVAKMDTVTLEEVNRVANQYLTSETLNLAIIGDIDGNKNFEEILKTL